MERAGLRFRDTRGPVSADPGAPTERAETGPDRRRAAARYRLAHAHAPQRGQTAAPGRSGHTRGPARGADRPSCQCGPPEGKSEGIDIKAAAGTAVKSADAGTVAAITQSADGVPIVVVRHDENLLTVYANVTDVSVAKGDQVSRGQNIAKLRSGNDAYVHFEVRKGFDSVDPLPYLQ